MSNWIAVSDRLPVPEVPVIAAYRNALGKWRRIRAVYIAPGSIDLTEVDYDSDPGDGFIPSGWYEASENGYGPAYVTVDDEVLLWQPLPALPEQEVGEDDTDK